LKVELVKLGCQMKDMQDHCKVMEKGVKVGGLYKLDVNVDSHQALLSTSLSAKKLWHIRYGHLNLKHLVLLQIKYMVKGLLIFKNVHVECDGCALGKQNRNEFPI